MQDIIFSSSMFIQSTIYQARKQMCLLEALSFPEEKILWREHIAGETG